MLRDGCGDAGEEEEERFEGEVGADGWGGGLLRWVGIGRMGDGEVAIEACHAAVESLCLDVFEGGEEDAVADGVFGEGEAEVGEDAAEADLVQGERGVLPHVLVLSRDEIGGVETRLEGVKWSSDEGLDGAGEEACCEG